MNSNFIRFFWAILLFTFVSPIFGQQTYRIEVGYVQPFQTSSTQTFRDTYFHGGKIGGTIDFEFPHAMSIHTGVFYSLAYGHNTQHWRSTDNNNAGIEYADNHVWAHSIEIPVRFAYTQKIWKELAIFVYAGPNFQVGLAQKQNTISTLSEATTAWLAMQNIDVKTGTVDLYRNGTLKRFNFQLGVGGGVQWGKYRLQSGYDFGMFNMCKNAQARQRGWYASFSYAF